MPGRSNKQRKRDVTGPGPADYLLRENAPKPAPRWGNSTEAKQRSASVGGPGPSYYHNTMEHDGPAYSLGSRFKAKCPDDKRQIGNPWTYFGYDDFGHTEHADVPAHGKLPPLRRTA